MAASIDGDIRLSVGLDTSGIEGQLKSLGVNIGRSIGKTMSDGVNKFGGLEKTVNTVNRSMNTISQSTKNFNDEVAKSEKATSKLFNTKFWKGYSNLLNALFNTEGLEKGQQAIDAINKKAEESNSRLVKLGASMANAFRGFMNHSMGMDEVGSTQALEDSVDRVEEKEKELGEVTQQTGQEMSQSYQNATKAEMQHELRLDKLYQKLDTLQRKEAELAQQKIYTDEYKEIEKELTRATNESDKLKKSIQDIEKNSPQLRMDEISKQIDALDQKFREMTLNRERNAARLSKAEVGAMYEQETQVIEQQNRLRQEYNQLKDTAGKPNPQLDRMKQQLEENEQKVAHLKTQLDSLNVKGIGYTSGLDSEKGMKVQTDIENTKREIDILNKKQEEVPKSAAKNASKTSAHWGKAFNKIKGLGGRMFGHLKGVFHRIKDKSKDSADSMDKFFRHGFRNILKYALGVRSFYFLFRKIRSAAKEALQAMAQQFPEVNAQMSALKNSFIQLKGSVGTLVQPLLQALAPALTTIINLFTQALTVVGSFFALLTGQKFIYKAQKGTSSFAKAQDKSTAATKKNTKALEDNQKQLGHYDKLNIIDQDKDKKGDGGGGGGGADAAGGEMKFVKTPIPDWIQDFMKRIKDAWKKADFTELGTILGTKLRDALAKIPWSKIQDVAIRLGKSIGTFIAGAIKVPGLAKKIGETIGQALNTLLLNLQAFIGSVPWKKLGEFLGDMINNALLVKDKKTKTTLIGNIAKTIVGILNAAIDTVGELIKKIRWEEIGKEIAKWLKWAIENIKFKEFMTAISNLVNGIVDLVYELVKDPKTWDQLGRKIGDGINSFFKNTDWGKAGKTLSNVAKSILNAIIAALDEIDWVAVGNAIASFLANIDWLGIMGKVATVIAQAFWGVIKACFTPSGNIGTDIAKAVTAALLTIFTIKKLSPLLTGLKGVFGKIFGTAVAQGAGEQVAAQGAATAGQSIGSKIIGAFGSLKGMMGERFANSLSGVLGAVGSHPLLIAATATLGLAIGKQIGDALSEQDWFDDVMKDWFGVEAMTQKEYDALVARAQAAKKEVEKELEPLTKKIEATNKSTESALKQIESFNKKLSTIDAGGKGVKAALQTFNELSKKTHLTAVETEALKGASKKLAEQYPELSKYIDKNTGVLKINDKKLKEVIATSKRHAKAVEAQKNAEKLYQQQAPLKKALEDAQKAYDDAKKKMDDYQKIWKETYNKWQKGLVDDATMAEANKKMQGYANAVVSANSALNKAKRAQQENNKAMQIANNLMELGKIKAEKIKEANNKLAESLKNTNLSAADQKKVLNELKTALEKGELSWKEYKSLVDKNYKSAGALKSELGKLGKTKVSPTLSVKVTGKDEIKRVTDYFSTFKNGQKTYKQILKIQAQYSDPAIKKAFASGYFSPSDYVNTKRKTIKVGKATGGVYTGSGWHGVEGYANGGIPKTGQFFMARENGIPELVGTIRNHTAVMNNNQIVASVSAGVYHAVASVAQAILPYVRSQTTAMNWLAQNGLQLPDIPKITLGNVVPNNAEFLNAMSGGTTNNITNGVDYNMLVQALKEAQSNQPIIIQMPNGKVLAEVVRNEEEKRYKQTRSSTLRPKFA